LLDGIIYIGEIITTGKYLGRKKSSEMIGLQIKLV